MFHSPSFYDTIHYMALQAKHNETTFHVGDIVGIYYRIFEKVEKAGKTKRSVESEIKERIQPFEGTVIAIKNSGENRSITVRRIGANNIGIERVFPLGSPWITKITVKRTGRVRRAKLYYLRYKSEVDANKIYAERHTR